MKKEIIDMIIDENKDNKKLTISMLQIQYSLSFSNAKAIYDKIQELNNKTTN